MIGRVIDREIDREIDRVIDSTAAVRRGRQPWPAGTGMPAACV